MIIGDGRREGRFMSARKESARLVERGRSALVEEALAAYLHVLRVLHGSALLTLLAHGLSAREVLVLQLLGERGTSSIRDLAVAGGLSRASADLLIAGLMRGGLVCRAEDPDDLRRSRMRLSGAGSALIAPLRRPPAQLEHTPPTLERPDLLALALGLPALAAAQSRGEH
jgi:DNA-binding MarR family transcriptional regulator